MIQRIAVATGLCAWLAMPSLGAARQTAPPSVPAGLIMGRVVDAETGKPLPSVIVEIASDTVAPQGAATTMTVDRKQLTNAGGRFVFRQLPEAGYTIRATTTGNMPAPNGFIQNSSGFPIGTYLAGGFGQQAPGGPIRQLKLADGQRVGNADIKMWRGSVIAGIVTDETGDSLVDAVVGAVRVSSDGRLTNGPTARTDDLGRYRLSALEPGRYVVFVPETQIIAPIAAVDAVLNRMQTLLAAQPAGTAMSVTPQLVGVRVGDALYSTMPQGMMAGAIAPRIEGNATLIFPTTFYPSATTLDVSGAIAVNAGEERGGVDVAVRPVRTASLSGTITAEGVPMPQGFEIHLLPGGTGDASLFEVAKGATDATGRFTFPAIPIGSYTIVAQNGPAPAVPPAAGAVMHSVSSVGGPGGWISQAVTVGPEGLSNLALTLQPGLALRGRVEFDGTSARPDENRVHGIRVSVTPSRPRLRSPDAPAQGGPDATGEFVARGFQPGRYVLQSSQLPGPWVLKSIEVAGHEAAELPIDITDDVAGVIVTYTDRAATVRVTVSDAPADGVAGVVLFPSDKTVWRDMRAGSARVRSGLVSTAGELNLARVLPGDYLAVALPPALLGDFPDVALLTRLVPQATPVRVRAGEASTLALTFKQVAR
jgi:hypothetical protein